MLRAALGLLLLIVAGAARAAPSAGAGAGPGLELPVERTITNPDWVRLPDARDMANYYPQIARLIGIGGRAVLHCTVAVDGGLADCRAIKEMPVGMGFGDAAIAMTGKFQMHPATVDGQPVAGGEINIPILFDPSPVAVAPASAPADRGPSPNPKALALAVRLAQLVHWNEAFAADADRYGSQLATLTQQQGLTAQEITALDSMKAAQGEYLQSVLGEREARMARDYSPDQLQRLIELFADPTAQLWFSGLDAMTRGEAENAAAARARVVQDARARFCQAVACLDAASASPPRK
ncbi:MAG TPA: energy transducer TonB [Caulobacteraceae bacterium]|nr:energy transducer TonB [Caulobacteraceae bacterium]